MKRIITRLTAAGVCLMLVTACVWDVVSFSMVSSADKAFLEAREKVSFPLPVKDTISKKEMILVLKYNKTCKDQQLRLQYDVLSSNETLVYRDTVSVVLFDEKTGKRMGKKRLSGYDYEYPLLRNIVFKESGTYKVSLLLLEKVSGVESIGVAIRKYYGER